MIAPNVVALNNETSEAHHIKSRDITTNHFLNNNRETPIKNITTHSDNIPSSLSSHCQSLTEQININGEKNTASQYVITANTHPTPSPPPPLPHPRYHLYPRRYFILLSFSLLTLTIAWIWIAFSPISTAMSHYWSVPLSSIDALPATYLLLYIPFSLPALYGLYTYGLRRGLTTAAVINYIGSLIRWRGLRSYDSVYVGTLFCGLAQTVVLSAPPAIAGAWFGCDERGMATAVGVLANGMGIAVGLGVTAVVDFYDGGVVVGGSSDAIINGAVVEDYVKWQHHVSALVVVLVMLCFTSDGPPTPPSRAAEQKSEEQMPLLPLRDNDDESGVTMSTMMPRYDGTVNKQQQQQQHQQRRREYLTSLRQFCCGTRSGLTFILLYGLSVGVYYTIPTFISQYVPHWSPSESGWLGFAFIASGIAGSLMAGRDIDRYRNYHHVLSLLLLGSSVSMAVLTAALLWCGGDNDDDAICNGGGDRVVIGAAVMGLGFFVAALIPVGFEYGTAMSYPADEATVAGVLECAAELGGLVLTMIGASLGDVGAVFNVVLLVSLLVSLFLLRMGVDCESKRPDR